MQFQTGYERNAEFIPVGELGIIALKSCEALGQKVNNHIVEWRQEREHAHITNPLLKEYAKSSYLLDASVQRFGSGEAKGIINGSVRGDDLYINDHSSVTRCLGKF